MDDQNPATARTCPACSSANIQEPLAVGDAPARCFDCGHELPVATAAFPPSQVTRTLALYQDAISAAVARGARDDELRALHAALTELLGPPTIRLADVPPPEVEDLHRLQVLPPGYDVTQVMFTEKRCEDPSCGRRGRLAELGGQRLCPPGHEGAAAAAAVDHHPAGVGSVADAVVRAITAAQGPGWRSYVEGTAWVTIPPGRVGYVIVMGDPLMMGATAAAAADGLEVRLQVPGGSMNGPIDRAVAALQAIGAL